MRHCSLGTGPAHPGLFVLAVLLAGCAPASTVGSGSASGVHLRVAGPYDCGADRFEVAVIGTGETTFAPEVVRFRPSEIVDARSLDPSSDAEGLYAVGEIVLDLPPGAYDLAVVAQEATADGRWRDLRRRPARGVHTGQGAVEVEETYDCDGEPTGLDVVVLVNEGPALVDFDLAPSRFTPTCGSVELAAVFDEPDGTELDVTWELFDAMGEDGHPDPATRLAAWTDPAPLRLSGDAHESTWEHVCEGPGTRYLQVTGIDDLGAETSFWSMVHCYGLRASDVCLEGDQLALAGTCRPDAIRPVLEPGCVARELATEDCPDPLAEPCTDAAEWPTCEEACSG